MTAGGTHVLRSGETLYSVARQYGVRVADLQELNDIDNPGRLCVGQRLRIPGKEGAQQVASARKNPSGSIGRRSQKAGRSTYTVQANDNLWSIARRHNVSVADLKRWNEVDEQNLQIGDTLVVGLK